MPTEWTDVASDAVKIGFGSLIGGMFTYLLARQSHGLQQKSEYEKRRRDSLEPIAASFDEEALLVINRSTELASLPFKKDKEAFTELLGRITPEGGEYLATSYKFHALEARLALLSLPEIAEEVERFRELATCAASMEPTFDDDEKRFAAASVDLMKQRTLVTTMMAAAYKAG